MVPLAEKKITKAIETHMQNEEAISHPCDFAQKNSVNVTTKAKRSNAIYATGLALRTKGVIRLFDVVAVVE